MDFQDSLWDIAVSSLVILAAAVFEILCIKTGRQMHRQTNAAKNSMPAIPLGRIKKQLTSNTIIKF